MKNEKLLFEVSVTRTGRTPPNGYTTCPLGKSTILSIEGEPLELVRKTLTVGADDAKIVQMILARADLDRWMQAIPAQRRRPETIAALLLPVRPVNPQAASADPAQYVLGLLLDPAYQLK